jgi:L-threonylcarbamoyladenylate synthase
MILPDNQANRERAARSIAAGGLIAFRTDTFYGLGADPLNPPALRQIIDLKGREGKPILLLVSDLAEVERFIIEQSKQFKRVTESFWPGPLTIVSSANPGLSNDLTSGTGTIGVRLPDNESLRDLIRLCGGALTATSANLTGATPARTAEEVAHYFQTGLELILDSGDTTATSASTVLDVTTEVPRLIREGLISRGKLEEILGRIEE